MNKVFLILICSLQLFSQETKIDSVYIAGMIAKGDSLNKVEKYRDALKTFLIAKEMHSKANYSSKRSRLKMDVDLNFKISSQYLYYLEEYKKAKDYIFAAQKITDKYFVLDSNLMFMIYSVLGKFYFHDNSNYAEAQRMHEVALNYTNSDNFKAYVYKDIGRVLFRQNYFSKSKYAFLESNKLKPWNNYTLDAIAQLYAKIFNFKKGYYYFGLIEKKKLSNRETIFYYTDFGYFNNVSGNPKEGKRHLEEAVKLLEQSDFKHSLNRSALIYMNLAVSHRFLGNLDSSLAYDFKSLEFANKIDTINSNPNLISHRNISHVYMLKQQYQNAYDYNTKIINRYKNYPSVNLGTMYFDQILLSEFYPEINILENMKKSLSLILPNYDKAKDGLMPEINKDLLNDYIYPLFQVAQEASYNKVLNAKTNNQELIQFTEKFSEYYLNYLKKFKETYPNSYFSPYFNKPYEESLFRYINYQFKQETKLEEGEVLNRVLNASLMLYNFKISHKLITGETLGNETLQDKVHLLREHKDMLEYYQNSPNAENKDENIFNYSEKVDSLLAVIRNESPLLENFQKEFELKDPRELSNLLKADEAILVTMNLDSQLFQLVIKRDNSIVSKSNITGKSLAEKLKSYLKKINLLENSEETSQELYHDLFKNIKSELTGVNKLYILPYADLSQIPFESLSYKDKNSKNRYLIEDYELSYHLSLPLLKKDLEKRVEIDFSKTLAMAPVFKKRHSIGSLAIDSSTYNLLKLRSIDENDMLVELKESEDEVKQISKIFKKGGYPSTVLIHNEATEKKLRDNTDYEIIHLATHSVSNLKNPSESSLFLSYKNKSDYKNDGVLRFDEIQNLDLETKLLILSSCESGVGKTVRGEGSLTLSSAFYSAGAKNVVNSLWKVFDKASKDFMIAFYQHLLAVKSVSSALRLTKLDYIKRGELPKVWAAFIQLGVN
jgi:CHAT domain-containing protein